MTYGAGLGTPDLMYASLNFPAFWIIIFYYCKKLFSVKKSSVVSFGVSFLITEIAMAVTVFTQKVEIVPLAAFLPMTFLILFLAFDTTVKDCVLHAGLLFAGYFGSYCVSSVTVMYYNTYLGEFRLKLVLPAVLTLVFAWCSILLAIFKKPPQKSSGSWLLYVVPILSIAVTVMCKFTVELTTVGSLIFYSCCVFRALRAAIIITNKNDRGYLQQSSCR